MMTTEEIEAIRNRAEKATEGPWIWDDHEEQHVTEMPVLKGVSYNVMNFGNCETFYPTEGTPPCEADAEFIAEAREDIPKLIAEVERLREVVNSEPTVYKFEKSPKDKVRQYYESYGNSISAVERKGGVIDTLNILGIYIDGVNA